ncbi:MAG: hypothetical protein NTX25_21165 [Proteobacteria bacterium]|nr:hypothetical protein [Pseudomonadota bacterium]
MPLGIEHRWQQRRFSEFCSLHCLTANTIWRLMLLHAMRQWQIETSYRKLKTNKDEEHGADITQQVCGG